MFGKDDVEQWYHSVFDEKNIVDDPVLKYRFQLLIGAVMEDRFISGAAKLVLCMIYVRLYSKNPEQVPGMMEDECCLDNHTMIEMLGTIHISPGTIQRGLKELKDLEYVSVRVRNCGGRRCRLIRALFPANLKTPADLPEEPL